MQVPGRRFAGAFVRPLIVGLVWTVPAWSQTPLGTAFSYQGRLTDAGSPASGSFDLQFKLFNAASAGAQVGPTVTVEDVGVSAGLFTVSLDFGASAFTGSKRWLEIGVRPGASTGAFTMLTPRQELTPAPHSLYAPIAAGAVTSAMLADGAVTSAKIAAGAVGATQIDQSQVQARVTATCPVGQYLRGINANGSVVCEPLSFPPTITTVSGYDEGSSSSIAIGQDGFPVISYVGWNASRVLKVAKCVNDTCTGPTITIVDDPANQVGYYSSIAIGQDGYPVISYYDDSAKALRVAKCVNAACTGTSTITTVDDLANEVGGTSTSIAIGQDGYPVISYQDVTAKTLKVAKCVNAACTGTSTITTVDDPANEVGNYASIAVGQDGFPVISHQDTYGMLKVAKCVNAACSETSIVSTLDDPPVNNVGQATSIAIGTDGRPVISYYDMTAKSLKVAKCSRATCAP